MSENASKINAQEMARKHQNTFEYPESIIDQTKHSQTTRKTLDLSTPNGRT